MKDAPTGSYDTLKYAIKSIRRGGYVKCDEPEYDAQSDERNFCTIHDIENFKVDVVPKVSPHEQALLEKFISGNYELHTFRGDNVTKRSEMLISVFRKLSPF